MQNGGWVISRPADCALMTVEMESDEDGRVSAEPLFADVDGSDGGGDS